MGRLCPCPRSPPSRGWGLGGPGGLSASCGAVPGDAVTGIRRLLRVVTSPPRIGVTSWPVATLGWGRPWALGPAAAACQQLGIPDGGGDGVVAIPGMPGPPPRAEVTLPASSHRPHSPLRSVAAPGRLSVPGAVPLRLGGETEAGGGGCGGKGTGMRRWRASRCPAYPRCARAAPSPLINHCQPTRRCRGPRRRETLMSLTISRKKPLS